MNEATSQEDRLLTYQELAKKMGLAKKTLQRMVARGEIPTVSIGHQIVRFHYPTVLKHLTRKPPG